MHCFVDGNPSGIDEAKVRAAFGSDLRETESPSCWRVTYGSENEGCDIYYDRDEHDSRMISSMMINRPVADMRLWDSLYQIMLLGNVIMFWPDGGPLVANRNVIPHLPPDVIEGLGEPDVIDRASDIPMAIEGRRFVYLRRQSGSAIQQHGVEDTVNVRETMDMAELEWLDGYSGQTTEQLLALEGRYREDSLVLAFEEAIMQKEARIGSDELSDEAAIVLAIEALEREVNNGGYDQFFVNTMEFSPVIVESLKRIGCPEVAAITLRAIDSLGLGKSPSIEAIETVIYDDDDLRDKKLQECDGEYFDKAGCLAEPLLEFIKTNKDNIRLP